MNQLVRWPARALGRDKNLLLRRSDRTEAAIMTFLFVIFLVAGAILGVTAGQAADRSDNRQLAAEQSWHQVPAAVLRVTQQPDGWVSSVVRWTAPDGRRRTGTVPGVALAAVGQHARVWVSGAGRLTNPPITRWQVYRDVSLDASALPAGLGLALLTAGGCIHLLMGRRRLRDWEQEWNAVGSRWSRSA
ncbi:MAG TPA: hypothetical protein VFX25_35280 [Streptosporangiaceae bacterium]|nr:hypothetical protein [Streptosporangiaceae bacterium]